MVQSPVLRAVLVLALCLSGRHFDRGYWVTVSPTLGSFRWPSPRDSFAELGALSQRNPTTGDTLIAQSSWLGRSPTNAMVAVADSQLSARVNSVAERCSAPQGSAVCTFKRSGEAPVSCTSVSR